MIGSKDQRQASARSLHTRRAPYAKAACQECRRRKVKCLGQIPCHRCVSLGLECICCRTPPYKDQEADSRPGQVTASASSVEYSTESTDIWDAAALRARITSLQAELQSVSAQLQAERKLQPDRTAAQQQASLAKLSWESGKTHAMQTGAEDHRYSGPASTAYSLEIVQQNLLAMGIDPTTQGEEVSAKLNAAESHSDVNKWTFRYALSRLSRVDAIRLCNVFANTPNVMYPLLDMKEIISNVEWLFDHPMDDPKWLEGVPEIILLVFAIALMIESKGHSTLARSFFRSTTTLLPRLVFSAVSITGIQCLVLASRYYFYSDGDETQAWRVIGIAARQCLEIGLHHVKPYTSMKPGDGASELRLFWTIFALDRRWSFGAGLPFTIQEVDIDPLLPEPDESCFYLKAMVSYSRISSKIWFSGLGTGELSKLPRESLEDLDAQVLDWQNQLPEQLRCADNPYHYQDSPDAPTRRMQIQMYVRAQVLRVLIFRPMLYSPTTIAENKVQATLCVSAAKDIIQLLHHIKKTTGMYDEQKAFFNFFILSSLASMFLACFHAPTDFCGEVQREIFMALEFVRGMNPKALVAKRLWKIIRNLRSVGERVGVLAATIPFEPSDGKDAAREHSPVIFGHGQGNSENSESGLAMANSGEEMSAELESVLESFGMYQANSVVSGTHDDYVPQNAWQDQSSPPWAINSAELSSILELLP